MIRLAARGIRATWEPSCGHLPELVVEGVPVLDPAPWRADPAIQSDEAFPWAERRLGGTFACAPFGVDDVDGGPIHGAAANAPWRPTRVAPGALTATRTLSRGRLTARIVLRDDHPVLYQTHLLDLDHPCTFAHHPVIRMRGGGRLSTATPSRVLTFDLPGEATRYAGGQNTDDPHLHTHSGMADWRDYPDAACDDFVALVHSPGLAFTALSRHAEGDTIVTLKQAAQLPLTGLWISNGARRIAPWNGRHRGRLGIEDGRFAGADGFAAALRDAWRRPVPTAFPPGRHVIPHAIVRLAGAHAVEDVALDGETLVIRTELDTSTVPFDAGHFA